MTSAVEGQEMLLAVTGLQVTFASGANEFVVVDDVSFSIGTGEVVGLVGESGCGKSVTAMSLVSLLPSPPSRLKQGSIRLGGKELTTMSETQMCKVRGAEVGFIFQEPMSSLNPVLTIGYQLSEALHLHRKISKSDAEEQAIQMLQLVGVSDPALRMKQYAFELSGGMRQRVVIAMALICSPRLLIADEPTTALDVTIQAQILELLADLQNRLGMAILMITHDLGVIAETCDRVMVMYAGRIVESGDVSEVFASPKHPYTKALLKSSPQQSLRQSHLYTIPGVVASFGSRGVGCSFADRCEKVESKCRTTRPTLSEETHSVECWFPC